MELAFKLEQLFRCERRAPPSRLGAVAATALGLLAAGLMSRVAAIIITAILTVRVCISYALKG